MFMIVALKECLMFLCTDLGRFNVCDRKSRKLQCFCVQIKEGFVSVIANQGRFNSFFCQIKESLMFLCTDQGRLTVFVHRSRKVSCL